MLQLITSMKLVLQQINHSINTIGNLQLLIFRLTKLIASNVLYLQIEIEKLSSLIKLN